MRVLIKILFWTFLVSLAVIIQSSHFLDFWGVNPNLILLFVFLPLILEKEFSRALILIFITLVLTVVFLPYWPKEILILAGLAFGGLFLRKFLTGQEFLDFCIFIVGSTLIFYLIANFHFLLNYPLTVIAEIFYNFILGGIIMIILPKISITLYPRS